MIFSIRLATLMAVLIFFVSANAQLPGLIASTTTPVAGAPHDYLGELSEIVNPADGSLSVRIKAPSPKERGPQYPKFLLVYDSHGAYNLTPQWQDFDNTWHLTNLYYGEDASADASRVINTPGQIEHTVTNLDSGWLDPNDTVRFACQSHSNYVYTDPGGGRHSLGVQVGISQRGNSQDCQYFNAVSILVGGDEFYKATIDPTTQVISLIDTHGNAPLQEDVNGNYAWGSGRGSTVSFTPNRAGTFNYTVPGTSGTFTSSVVSRQQTATLSYAPTGGQPSCNSSGSISPYQGFSINVPQQITIPNSTAYTFTTDPTSGLIQSITYPTGETVTYTWSINPQSEGALFKQPGIPNGGTCSLRYDTFAITKRVVSVDGQNPVQEQDFTYQTNWDPDNPYLWTSKSTTVTTKDLVRNQSFTTVYTYSPIQAPNITQSDQSEINDIPQESSIITYDFDGTVANTVTKTWLSISQLGGDCVTPGGGQTSGRFYTYQPYYWSSGQPNNANPYAFETMLPTTVAEYDYGHVASTCVHPSSVPDRETDTTYWSAPAPYPPYFSGNEAIVDRPSAVKIYDGTSGSKKLIAETDYGYDETSVSAAAGSLTGHDPAYAAGAPTSYSRGNNTTITRQCFPSCTAQVIVSTFDETGNVVTQRDPKGYLYQFDHTDNYTSGGSPSGNTNIFLTKLTKPPVHGITYYSTFSYGYLDGLLRSSTDENGQTTTICYNIGGCTSGEYDPWMRVTGVQSPLNGYITATYTDQVGGFKYATDKVQSADGSEPDVMQTHYLDGMGRETRADNDSDPDGVTHVDTKYDGLGMVWKVSNPFRDPETELFTETTYDALGRKKQVTETDSNTLRFTYSGATTTGYDERGTEHIYTADAFGRMIAVTEMSGGIALGTAYSYDMLGNLLSVNQVGRPGVIPAGFQSAEVSKQRAFTYNSLSQLLSTQNPETGVICYGRGDGTVTGCHGDGYDLNGNIVTKTDAVGTSSTYHYDPWNRVTYSQFSDGTRGQHYGYDGMDESDNPMPSPFHLGQVGRLSHTSDEIHIASNMEYDARGRLTLKSDCLASDCNYSDVQTAGYDLADNLISLSYPDGRVVKQTWNGAGRVSAVVDATQGGSQATYASGQSGRISYLSSGVVGTVTYGNSLTQTFGVNSRLQPCSSVANALVAGSTIKVWDRQSYYHKLPSGSSATSPCINEANNNGSIYSIVNNEPSSSTQNFDYDALNRISIGSRSDNVYSQNYYYDSFGNLIVKDNLVGSSAVEYDIDSSTNRLLRSHDGGVTWGDYKYDATGALTQSSDGIGPTHTYQHNAMGQLLSVDGGSDTYLYDGWAQRAFKQTASGTTDYVYFNGAPIAEKDQNGNWTDYIYANGQKIARVQTVDPHLHVEGNSPGGQYQWYDTGLLSGYTIKAGDKLIFRQFQKGGARGGLTGTTTSGISATGVLQDQTGDYINSSSVSNAWETRIVSLDSAAGLTVSSLQIGMDTGSAGSGSVDVADISVLSTDGSVQSVFNGQAVSLSFCGSCGGGMSQGSGGYVTAADPTESATSAYYYVDDHLGTTQMELSSGGWPVWSRQFTPFGQEIGNQLTYTTPGPQNSDGTAMHYKFTGKERDNESGFDCFGARYYASMMGRWITPDWAARAEAVPYSDLHNPQSLNLYSYVGNNPLSRADLDGHYQRDAWNFYDDQIALHQAALSNRSAMPSVNLNMSSAEALYEAEVANAFSAAQQQESYTAGILGKAVPITITADTMKTIMAISAKLDGTLADINAHAGQLTQSELSSLHNINSITVGDNARSGVDTATGNYNMMTSYVMQSGTAWLASTIAHDSFHVTQAQRGEVYGPKTAARLEHEANQFQIQVGRKFGLSQSDINYIRSDTHTLYNTAPY